MSSFIKKTLTKRSDDTMDDDNDDKDDSKRKSRNLSEKKRRDQFNMLINELSSMVSTNTRKMDKSTVLKSTISFLKNHNEIAVQSRAHEIQEDWKPSFLSNEEFTHLILEALDGFIMVFSSSGKIYYASESITSLLGYLPNDLLSMSIFDMVYEEDQSELYNILMNPANNTDNFPYETQITFNCHLKRGGLENKDQLIYESVQFDGYFRPEVDSTEVDNISNSNFGSFTGESDTRIIFVGTGRLNTRLLLRDMSIVDSTKSEFTSRHSLEWKFLFLDHRAPPIIGYLPFEVLGTSGYDYYHVDDLEKVVICHEALMQKGEGTSCYYRFLTKGQQWIWLQTRFYITYHQWNSKPEFIVCTHRVVSYVDVMKQLFKNETEMSSTKDKEKIEESFKPSTTPGSHTILSSPWSSKSSVCKRSTTKEVASSPSGSKGHSRAYIPGPGSDSTTSMSADSPGSRQSQLTASSIKHSQQQQQQPLLHHQQHQQETSKIPSSTSAFNEQIVVQPNACQYAPAIPVQPTFPIPATLSTQDQIQEQLQRKHEELQQLIVAQQEELRRVSEQLFMARYGILPPLQLNVSLPYSTPATVSSTTTAPMVPNHNTPVLVDPNQVNIQLQNAEDGMAFQMSQQQTQLLFASPSHGHHNSQ